jgi:adenosylmethionine-8-amino-7-oxononanoate aminotransferase
VARPFWETPGLLWRHGYTYSGHASAAAAAMANLDIIEREALVAQVRSLELTLAAALVPLRRHAWVAETRAGFGLLGAVTLHPSLLAEEPTAMTRVLAGLRARGVLTRALADGSVQISPPFVVTRADLQGLAAALDGALSEAGSTRSAGETATDDGLLPEVTSDELGGFGSTEARLLADVPPHHGS